MDGDKANEDDFKEDFGWKYFRGFTITPDGYAVVSLDREMNSLDFKQIEGIHIIRGLSIKNMSQEKAESLLNRIVQYSTIPRFHLNCGTYRYRPDFIQNLKKDLKFTVFYGKLNFHDPVNINPLNFLKQFVDGLEAFK